MSRQPQVGDTLRALRDWGFIHKGKMYKILAKCSASFTVAPYRCAGYITTIYFADKTHFSRYFEISNPRLNWKEVFIDLDAETRCAACGFPMRRVVLFTSTVWHCNNCEKTKKP